MMNEVLCADCLSILRGMPDNAVDWLITDPPYGQAVCPKGIVGGARRKERRGFNAKAKEFEIADWDKQRPGAEYFREMLRVSKQQIIFGGNFFADLLPPSRCWIVWDKGRRTQHSDCELAWTSLDAPARMVNFHMNSVLAKLKSEPRLHPTQKPLDVMSWIITRFTAEGETILDPFCGSGSTLAAAQRLGRRFIGIDLSEHYCEIARLRTAQKALF